MATVVGGVLIHRDRTWRFGFTLPEQRRAEANTRYVETPRAPRHPAAGAYRGDPRLPAPAALAARSPTAPGWASDRRPAHGSASDRPPSRY